MVDNFKILIAIDKFKGSLDAKQAADIIKEGLHKVYPNLLITSIPMADGGEGTTNVIEQAIGGERIFVKVLDPLLREIDADYLISNETAYIEMSKTSGLNLLKEDEYNPMITTTYGFGQLIRNAAEKGIRKIFLGIGGSATNDAGVGMLKAFGFKFRDRFGRKVEPGGGSLARVFKIDDSDLEPWVKELSIKVACDVNNPLLGENGATKIYSSQKGATESMIEKLEKSMLGFSEASYRKLGVDYSQFPGSGAAGGVGFALKAYLNAQLLPGWQVLSEIINLEERVKESNLIITGEGSLDTQSLSGKLISGIVFLSEKHSKPVWIYCGVNSLTEQNIISNSSYKIFSLQDIEPSKRRSIQNAKSLLKNISEYSATFLP